jgi:hypothetical protein
LSSLISLNPNHILQPLVLLILETRPTYETKGAFGRASTGSAPHTKPGALPNGLQKRLRSRSSSGSPTLEHYGRGGSCKNPLPRSSHGSAPPFASPAPGGVHRGTTVAGARKDGYSGFAGAARRWLEEMAAGDRR